jgi:2-hydroxy-6-oxonona-2,4-dienedioate hydrolase
MPIGAEARWRAIAGTNTRYFDQGEGPVILLVTGGHFGNATATSPIESWEYNFLPLSRMFRVIAVEKLGQGETDNPQDNDYTMQAVARHLAAFVVDLDLRDVNLVGQSAGCMPVVVLARDIPDRIRSCTLINSSTLAPGVGMTDVNLAGCPYPPFTRDGQRWVFQRSAFDPATVTDSFVEDGFRVMMLPKYREAVDAMQKGGLKEALFAPRLAQLKNEMLTWLSQGGLKRPTQVVWGCNDRTASVERGIALFRMIAAHEPDCRLHLINRAGHHPFREHPDHFNALMRAFIEGAMQ